MRFAVRLLVVWLPSRRRLVVVTRRWYYRENGRADEVLVEGSEIWTPVLVVVQVAKVMGITIVGIGDRVRIDGVIVTCSGRRVYKFISYSLHCLALVLACTLHWDWCANDLTMH